jgi:hypothetical protein
MIICSQVVGSTVALHLGYETHYFPCVDPVNCHPKLARVVTNRPQFNRQICPD